MENFRAFRIYADDAHRAEIETLSIDDLSEGDVVIEAHYSSVNYKDALAGAGKGKILRRSPLNGGIDVAGVVAQSDSSDFKAGDEVLVTGCGLSEVHDGGYAEYARVKSDWMVPLPESLSLEQAMILGTAGFTAALAMKRLEDNHQNPAHGPILITGATGGVGSFAIDMLADRGFEVAALTGKADENGDYLKSLGASQIVNRHQLEMGTQPMEKPQWGGAVDNVGGETLAWLTRTVQPWGNIVSIGLAGGLKLETTVMPFILRGVALLGVTSANCPIEWRRELWQRLATDLRPRHLDGILSEQVTLEQLPDVFQRMLAGETTGRIVVQLKG